MELFEGLQDDELESLELMLDGLSSVYRFIGSKHEVSKTNSVLDHINGLSDMIEELFDKLPIAVSPARVDLLRAAYLHDAGEFFGELAVLDNILDTSKTPAVFGGELKESIETTLFCQAIGFLKDQIRNKCSRKEIFIKTEKAREAVADYLSSSKRVGIVDYCSPLLSAKYNVSSKLLYYYLHHTCNPDTKALFKLLDLAEGCKFYVNNALNPQNVPKEHKDRYIRYYVTEINKLLKHNFIDRNLEIVRLGVLRVATDIFNDYLKLMAI